MSSGLTVFMGSPMPGRWMAEYTPPKSSGRICRYQLSLTQVVLKLAAEKLYSHSTVMAGIIFDKDDSPVVDSVILE